MSASIVGILYHCYKIRLKLDIHVSSPPPPPPEPPPWWRKLISLVIKAAAYFATL